MVVLKRMAMELKDIKIKSYYKYPKKEKLKSKYYFYYKNKILQEKIIVDKDNYLIDGYTSYLIAKKENMKSIVVFKEIKEIDAIIDNDIQEKGNMYKIDKISILTSVGIVFLILVILKGLM